MIVKIWYPLQEMKSQGIEETRLQLLRDVSGAFRPGVLTALVGVSGAGKTTLMDVLAGRKTGGYIEGSISISGYPKNQETFLGLAVFVNKMIFILHMLLSMSLLCTLPGFVSQRMLMKKHERHVFLLNQIFITCSLSSHM